MSSHPLLDNFYLTFYFWDMDIRYSCIEGSTDYLLLKELEIRVYEHRTYM